MKLTLPDCEADRYSRVEVTTADGSAGNDCKRDAQSKGPSNLEERAKNCDSNLFTDSVGGRQRK